MELYFMGKPYNKEEVEKKLLNLRYYSKPLKISKTNITSYLSPGDVIRVSPVSDKKGTIQIQGPALEDLYDRNQDSIYYPMLEDLVKALEPDRIVDASLTNLFTQLIK